MSKCRVLGRKKNPHNRTARKAAGPVGSPALSGRPVSRPANSSSCPGVEELPSSTKRARAGWWWSQAGETRVWRERWRRLVLLFARASQIQIEDPSRPGAREQRQEDFTPSAGRWACARVGRWREVRAARSCRIVRSRARHHPEAMHRPVCVCVCLRACARVTR